MLTLPNANLTRARHAADKLIKRFRIARPEDITLEDIAMAVGVLVVEDKLEGSEARLLRKGGKGIIRVKAGIPEIGRRRFAIGHELGHWELHADLSQWVLCSEADLLGYSASPPEIEANTFAAELLMPTNLFRPRCERVEPSLELIKALAHDFHITMTATAIRFVEECREPCLVVFSENGRVRWWKSRNREPGMWIASHQPLLHESFAWDCLKDTPVPNTMQPVPRRGMVSGIPHGTKNRCLRAIDAVRAIPYYPYTPVDCLKSLSQEGIWSGKLPHTRDFSSWLLCRRPHTRLRNSNSFLLMLLSSTTAIYTDHNEIPSRHEGLPLSTLS